MTTAARTVYSGLWFCRGLEYFLDRGTSHSNFSAFLTIPCRNSLYLLILNFIGTLWNGICAPLLTKTKTVCSMIPLKKKLIIYWGFLICNCLCLIVLREVVNWQKRVKQKQHPDRKQWVLSTLFTLLLCISQGLKMAATRWIIVIHILPSAFPLITLQHTLNPLHLLPLVRRTHLIGFVVGFHTEHAALALPVWNGLE